MPAVFMLANRSPVWGWSSQRIWWIAWSRRRARW